MSKKHVFTFSRAGFKKSARVIKSVSPGGDEGPQKGQTVMVRGDTFVVTQVDEKCVKMEALPNTPIARTLDRNPSIFDYTGAETYAALSL